MIQNITADIKLQISNKQTRLKVLCKEVKKTQETINLLYEALKEIEHEEIQNKSK